MIIPMQEMQSVNYQQVLSNERKETFMANFGVGIYVLVFESISRIITDPN